MSGDALTSVLDDARRLGFLGPEPVGHHVTHARAWAEQLEMAPFLDLGSGGGIPGLILATDWPVTAVLLEAQSRRAAWLRTAVVRLGLAERVRVVEGRAEDLAHDSAFRERSPVVVARSFGPPATTAECGSGLTALGGTLTVSDPPTADRRRWQSDRLDALGLEISDEVVQPAGSFVILRKRRPLGDSLPRRRNLPRRRPLW